MYVSEYKRDFMKIKFNSDDNLPLNKMLKLCMLTVIVRSVFEDGKYYPQVFFHDFFMNYKSQNRIDISEGIDINKRNASKECDICHYWNFLDKNFKYEPYLCHDSMQKAMNFNEVAIVSVKGSDYRIYFWYVSKNDAINILKNSNLNEKKVDHYIFFIMYKNEWNNLLSKKQGCYTK